MTGRAWHWARACSWMHRESGSERMERRARGSGAGAPVPRRGGPGYGASGLRGTAGAAGRRSDTSPAACILAVSAGSRRSAGSPSELLRSAVLLTASASLCVTDCKVQLTVVPERPIALDSLYDPLHHPPRLPDRRRRFGVVPHDPRQAPDQPPLSLRVLLRFLLDRLFRQIVRVVRGREDSGRRKLWSCGRLLFALAIAIRGQAGRGGRGGGLSHGGGRGSRECTDGDRRGRSRQVERCSAGYGRHGEGSC